MQILRQASCPSTSAEGSVVSAYPRLWASFSASSKERSSRFILVSMKLVVPLRMPAISVNSLAAMHW